VLHLLFRNEPQIFQQALGQVTVPFVTMYTNYIISLFATTTQIQQAGNNRANSKLAAVCQSAFFFLHISD
jgi:hypothetical protein